jgi:hypothetical protein
MRLITILIIAIFFNMGLYAHGIIKYPQNISQEENLFHKINIVSTELFDLLKSNEKQIKNSNINLFEYIKNLNIFLIKAEIFQNIIKYETLSDQVKEIILELTDLIKNIDNKILLEKDLILQKITILNNLCKLLENKLELPTKEQLFLEKLSEPALAYINIGQFEELLQKIAKSKALVSLYDGQTAIALAKSSTEKALSSIGQSKKLVNQTIDAQNKQRAALLAINNFTDKDSINYLETKKLESDKLLEKFTSQLDDLINNILSGIDKKILANQKLFKEELISRLNSFENLKELTDLKELFDKEIKTLDSQINTAKDFYKILTSRATRAAVKILTATGFGFATAGQAGALKGLIGSTAEILGEVLLNYFTTKRLEF